MDYDKTREIFQTLSTILPDADPVFLEEFSSKYSANSDDLNKYIDQLLSSKEYPKKQNNHVNTEKPDSSHRSSVEEFLNKFKEPLKYFNDRNVGLAFERSSQLYLRAKFKMFSVKLINQVLRANNYNLTLTKHSLDVIPADRTTKRAKHELIAYNSCQNEDFCDEVYFLDHEEELNKILKDREELQKLRLEEAKQNQELLECQCCYNDEVFSSDVITCLDGHIFCKECVKRSVEIAFGDGHTVFKCLCECSSEFKVENLKGLLIEPLYRKIHLKIQEGEVKAADITGICFCPYCEYAEVPADGDKVFKCKICFKESCRFCQAENHIPMSCQEYEEDKRKTSARADIENKMTAALIRECYKCKAKFIKQDGCNKMQCVCGALMCYICRQPVKDYSHFHNNSRPHDINLPSTSNNDKKCPLWTENTKLHVDAVIQAAETAMVEIENRNPELHFERQTLLKGLKRKKNV